MIGGPRIVSACGRLCLENVEKSEIQAKGNTYITLFKNHFSCSVRRKRRDEREHGVQRRRCSKPTVLKPIWVFVFDARCSDEMLGNTELKDDSA